MEACKSKRKSRTDRIINISWCYFILLDHQWNLCDRGNSWNAIFLADLSEIKEGSWVDPEKNVLTAMNDLKSGFVGESVALTFKCQGTDFIIRVWSPDMVFLLTLFSHMALTNQIHQKVHIDGTQLYQDHLSFWSRVRSSTYRLVTWQTREDMKTNKI